MINAILIDDERPALRELEYLLSDYQDIAIVGTYTNPMIALKEIEEIKPQIVFLDICMTQLSGMDLASKLAISCPHTDIVFVTAYDSYAVEAFDVCALDYLLKPINKKRLEKTVHRVMQKNRECVKSIQRKMNIKCFGEFLIGWENEEPIKWRTEKTKELFAFLLHNHGNSITKYQIIDAIWPDIDPDKAEHQLYNGIYYIRRTLNEYGIPRENIILNGNYCLKLDNINFDLIHFKEYLNKSVKTIPIKVLRRLEEEYTGEYFGNNDWEWARYDRHVYAKQYYKIAYTLADMYIQNYEFEKAESFLEKIIKINPYDERPIMLLMKTYVSMNNRFEAKRLYDYYCRTVKEDLDILPSSELRDYYHSIESLKLRT
jgi:two-component system LytT family response regulator